MDPVIQKFRSALGGFHRQDVLQYIEKMSNAHRREMNELQKELTRSEARCRELEDTLSGLESEKGSVAAEQARVRASLEESTATLTRLRGELSEAEEQLAAVRAELEHYRREAAEMAPMAQCYEELKDRVATVELDAHRKAQATVDEARAQAEQLKQETRAWLEEALRQYGEVRRGVDELLGAARALNSLEEQLHRGDQMAHDLAEHGGIH